MVLMVEGRCVLNFGARGRLQQTHFSFVESEAFFMAAVRCEGRTCMRKYPQRDQLKEDRDSKTCHSTARPPQRLGRRREGVLPRSRARLRNKSISGESQQPDGSGLEGRAPIPDIGSG